jgi:hypothetical protein
MDNTTTFEELTTVDETPSPGIRTDMQAAMKIINYCIGIFAVAGNLAGFVTFTRVRTVFRKKVRLLVIHQCFVDMVAGLLLVLHTIFDSNFRLLGGLAGQLQCKLWLTKLFLWATFLTSTLNLCCIYIAVVWPLKYRENRWQKSFYPSLVVVWIFPVIFNSYKITTAVVSDEQCQVYGNWPSVTTKTTNGTISFFGYFLVPLSVLVFCFSQIIRSLGSNRVAPSIGTEATEATRKRSRKNAIKTLVYMSMMFVFCWIWNQVYFLLLNLGVDLDFAHPFYHFTVISVTSNCAVNPFIYLVQCKALGIIKKSIKIKNKATVATVSAQH